MPGAPSSEHCSGHEMTPFARHRGEALLLAQAVEVQVAVTPRSANVQRGPVWSFRSGSVLRLEVSYKNKLTYRSVHVLSNMRVLQSNARAPDF